MTNAEWPADHVERRPIADLAPYASNARTHSAEQVAQIAASMQEWGWTNPVLVDEAGTIIAGHGRIMAAKSLGYIDAPVMVARGWTPAQIRAYVIADNQLAVNAGWDKGLLASEIAGLKEWGFDTSLLGFEPDEEAPYTRKIVAPTYEPTGDKPALSALVDRSKAASLVNDIITSGVTEAEKEFLLYAADRHTVFNFRLIADYYAHAEAEMQDLMERSALVIIDFDKAIANGYVQLSEKIAAQYSIDSSEPIHDDDD